MQTSRVQNLEQPVMDEPDDNELMLRFQAGDMACFEMLVNRHKQRVMNLVYRFMQGSSDAEDVAQEVFIRIYKAKDKYKATARFTTWLHTICRNTCYNAMAKKKRRPMEHLEDLEMNDEIAVDDHLADKKGATPDDQLMYDELANAVKKGVDSLPVTQRTAFILARYEQCSYEEIATVMECSTKAVKSLLNRARTNLRARMKKYV